MADTAIITVENVGGFIFDIIGTAQHTLESDITDHYIEDNTAIQDHWALKPEKIVLKNYQGEVSSVLSKIDNSQTVPVKLDESLSVLVNDMLPQDQQSKLNIVETMAGTEIVPNAYENIKPESKTDNTRQKYTYEFFKNLRNNRTLVSCTTPYGVFENMAIENIVSFQDEDTKQMSSFTITLKNMRFADTILVPYNFKKYQSRNATQQAPEVKSKSQGKNETFLYGLLGKPIENITKNIPKVFPKEKTLSGVDV